MSRVFVIAAKRTAVVPRGGAFNQLQADELAAPVIQNILDDCKVEPGDVDQVILGNALYGGGNVARVAALRAGLPETVPAMTLDTQCCGGMDAAHYGAALIRSGMANMVLVGGAESYSRSAIRAHRPLDKGGDLKFYDRPSFTPFADRDPDMLSAAATLAEQQQIPRIEQEAIAIESHRKALAFSGASEIVSVNGISKDTFSRKLTQKFCDRLPVFTGSDTHGLTAATVAVEADAASILLLVSEKMGLSRFSKVASIEYLGSCSIGCNPEIPAVAPIAAMKSLLKDHNLKLRDMAAIEIMEAFAVQMISISRGFEHWDQSKVNRSGGGLSRGHPIGASGAINLVRLYAELSGMTQGKYGIAAIAAAGGLGSSVLLQKIGSQQ
jgi:acetyl-CoA C-acetyltransferase